MKALLVAGLFAALLVATPSHAEGAPGCAVPAYLLATESALPKVADAIKTRKRLDILVAGSGSSTLPGSDGASMSYPSRLEAALREALAGVTVNVRTELRPKKTAAEAAQGFGQMMDKLPPDQKPDLVIWQTGTVDAIRSVDPDDFRTALDAGVEALQKSGSDVLLINLQYNPRMETMLSVGPYNDTMRVVAQQYEVPMFDRFSIMRHWNDAGDFDLFGSVHGYGMAKRVHDCIGRALAAMVVEASRINPAELRIQR
ncbi:SGNH/GDSL hydrolase family protein [Afipia massiliensis]|uniref:SGNH/GDSL hydrolase family protein n=1 Tax=Afipia massiliensis TaxID=211460 RepID=A0A4U6BL58_9BRAD|nr:GDSL-type esterase/lipase family protein [Afipia massiliensis]TKT70969.1 SGNH/GDSL hydrolase family protein [Afipia massiliensis]